MNNFFSEIGAENNFPKWQLEAKHSSKSVQKEKTVLLLVLWTLTLASDKTMIWQTRSNKDVMVAKFLFLDKPSWSCKYGRKKLSPTCMTFLCMMHWVRNKRVGHRFSHLSTIKMSASVNKDCWGPEILLPDGNVTPHSPLFWLRLGLKWFAKHFLDQTAPD